MIPGCHEAVDDICNAHRHEELCAIDKRLVELVRECGLIQAVESAHPQAGCGVMARTWSDPWFIEDMLKRLDNGENLKSGKVLRTLDLSPLRTMIAAKQVLVAAIIHEREELFQTLESPLENQIQKEFAPTCPPDIVERTRVVCGDGIPRLVFHATDKTFESFKPVSHFGSATTVSRHIEKSLRRFWHADEIRIVSAWLDIQNPLRVADLKGGSMLWLLEAAVQAGALSLNEVAEITGMEEARLQGKWWLDKTTCSGEIEVSVPMDSIERDFVRLLQKHGYDGIVYANAIEGGESWVALDPCHIHIAQEWHYKCDPGCSEQYRMVEQISLSYC
jgi:hypothetical protein